MENKVVAKNCPYCGKEVRLDQICADNLLSDGTTKMIVSRGIGNSAFPFRFNN